MTNPVDNLPGIRARLKCWDIPPCASTPPGSLRFFDRAMSKTFLYLSAVLFSLLLPPPSFAQCSDQLCQNIQKILDEAVTDFREFRTSNSDGPNVSIDRTNVPCQMSLWANNVPMYICYAKVPGTDSQRWYARTLQILQGLNPSWHFQINSSGEDHYVDGGPPDCEIPPNDGPHRGQCPVHLQTMKQGDGTTKLYLWVNSYSSPYLLKAPPAPPSARVSSAPAASSAASPPSASAASTASVAPAAGCDDFCQNLKKVFEARSTAFATIRTSKTNEPTSDVAIKLAGATQCAVNGASATESSTTGAQFVCYWREPSASAAESRFRDLVSRLQMVIPSNWSIRRDIELDDSTGADLSIWFATEPGGKPGVRIYLLADSVGLHITARN